jgi:capsular exopolysaccharide synthesis family protein
VKEEYGDYDVYVEEGSALNEYLSVLGRRKRIILACLLISVFIVGVTSVFMDKMYRAKATIEIAPEDPKVTGFEEQSEINVQQQDEFYETQYKLLKSRSLAAGVIKKLNLQSFPEFSQDEKHGFLAEYVSDYTNRIKLKMAGLVNNVFPMKIGAEQSDKEDEPTEQEELVDSFLSRVEVTPDRESRLVEVSFDSTDPKLSAKTVNTLADEYIEWVLQKKLSSTKSAEESLGNQLTKVREKLETTQDTLNRFAKKWDIVSLDKDLNLTYKQLAELNDALAKAETERLTKEALYEETKTGKPEYLPEVMNDPAVQQLKADYVRIKAQYDDLDARYGANYPEMKEAGAQLASVRHEMGAQLTGIVSSIERGYESAKKKEDLLRQRAEIQKDRAADLNEIGAEYQALEKEVDTNKTIYQNLLQKQKETEVTSGIRSTNVHVIDYAYTPLSPFKPNILLNILIAAILGTVGGVLLAFGFEHFDRTIRDEEDIKKRLSIPFMGKIPRAKRSEVEQLQKIVYTNPQSKISEAFRVLKTSVLYSLRDRRPPKALMVTSTQPLEGKTTISSNLALTMVQSGLKVILVDADLRRPSVHKVFLKDINGGPGLSSYLTGDAGLDKIVYSADVSGLDIIPAGPIMPNPADLIDSKRMKELIDHLVKKYDNVILDGIPVMELADARLLSRQVDSVLLVASVGIVDREGLRSSMEDLIKVGAQIIGVVVNRLEFGNKGGSVYDYYYVSSNPEKDKVRFAQN